MLALLLAPALAADPAAGRDPDLDVGVGLRAAPGYFDALPFGGRVFGRVGVVPRLALEVGLAARFPSDAIAPVAESLIVIGDLQVPVVREVASGALLANVSPWAEPLGGRVAVWPHALVGVEARVLSSEVATSNPAYPDEPGSEPVLLGPAYLEPRISPAAGLGADLLVDDRVGVRLHQVARLSVEEAPDYGNEAPAIVERRVVVNVAVGADVFLRF